MRQLRLAIADRRHVRQASVLRLALSFDESDHIITYSKVKDIKAQPPALANNAIFCTIGYCRTMGTE